MIEIQRKILLIDERLDRKLYAALVEGGIEVITCESPKNAWDLVYPIRPDFIVLHLYHPGPEDAALLPECRVMAEGAPVIVAASDPRQEWVMKLLEDRANAFLTLPAEPHEVRRLLDEVRQSATAKR